MPRRGVVAKRLILPDPKYRSETVAKFINVIMTRGKKSVAEHIVYGAFDIIGQKIKIHLKSSSQLWITCVLWLKLRVDVSVAPTIRFRLKSAPLDRWL